VIPIFRFLIRLKDAPRKIQISALNKKSRKFESESQKFKIAEKPNRIDLGRPKTGMNPNILAYFESP